MNAAPTTIRYKARRVGITVVAALCLWTMGCIVSEPNEGVAVAADPITVAAIYSLSGSAAANNAASIAGFRAGVADVNGKGGVLGRFLNPVLLDNLSTPIGSLVAARKAHEAGAVAIIGPAWSSHALAAAREAQSKKLPMITSIATNPAVTLVGDYIFRTCFTDRFQGLVMAAFARQEIKAKTAILFTDITSDFSLGLSGEFAQRFARSGGALLETIKYKPRRQDYRDMARKAKELDADVCFIPGHDESGIIIKALVDAGARCLPLGGDGWVSDAFFKKGGGSAPESYYCGHWSKESDNPVSRELVDKYGETETLDSSWILAYDAVHLLADALKRAGTTDRGALRDTLADTRGYLGASGYIAFNANGDPIKDAIILRIQNNDTHFHKRVTP